MIYQGNAVPKLLPRWEGREVIIPGFPHILESPGIFSLNSRPWYYSKTGLVLESPWIWVFNPNWSGVSIHCCLRCPVFGLVVSTYICGHLDLDLDSTHIEVDALGHTLAPFLSVKGCHLCFCGHAQNLFSVSLKCTKFSELNLGKICLYLLTPAVRFEGWNTPNPNLTGALP